MAEISRYNLFNLHVSSAGSQVLLNLSTDFLLSIVFYISI